MRKILLILTIVALSVTKSSAQIISVNTNAMMDAMQAYSFGFELVLNKRSSLAVDGFWGNKIMGRNWKMIAFQPEWRLYFGGRPLFHHYIGAVGILTKYDLEAYSKRYHGHAMGAGLSYGYVWPVTRRLLIDFHTSLGFVGRDERNYMADETYADHVNNDKPGDSYSNHYVEIPTNSSATMLCPIKIGVSVSYILK
ncbi:MAG: DUF3575 domain-containing protein [Prevotella sp.]|nr:DUF3575 domain-containing protein [Prevotella sp.]